MEKRGRLLLRWGLGLLLAGTMAGGLPPALAGAPGPVRVGVGYVTVGAGMAPVWVAKEAGLFEAHGLKADLAYVAGTSKLAAAVLAGDVTFALTGIYGTVASVLGGSDLVILSGTIRAIPFMIMARPEIQKPEELRGKRIGLTRFGSPSEFAARFALKGWGLEPVKEVAIIQTGGVGEALSALASGAIQAAVLSDPVTLRAKKMGFRMLADMSEAKVPYLHHGAVARRPYVAANHEVTLRFMRAHIEGIYYFMRRPEFSRAVIAKYTRITDPEVLQETHALYAQKFFQWPPMPLLPGIQTLLDELAPRVPRAREARPEEFVDLSFYNELERQGFFKLIQGRYGA